MENFLLLGQIPGTNMVITFGQWAILFSGLLMTFIIWHKLRQSQLVQQKLAQTKALMAKRIDPTILDQIAL